MRKLGSVVRLERGLMRGVEVLGGEKDSIFCFREGEEEDVLVRAVEEMEEEKDAIFCLR